MNILPVRLIKLTHSSCVCCGFWRSRPFQACFTITVIPVKKEKQVLNNRNRKKLKYYSVLKFSTVPRVT